MNRNVLHVSLLVCVLGCSTPQRQPAPTPSSADASAKELAQLKEAVANLQNKVGHLESEISAASAEGELTAMTIDRVQWSGKDSLNLGGEGAKRELLCHVVEWKGFGKMKRFTKLADPNFVLEAEGRPTVAAMMAEGGVCNADGSTRFVCLTLFGDLEPKTAYRLHAQNKKTEYQWALPADLTVAATEAKQ